MKTNPNQNTDPIAQWIKASGTESPTSGFSSRVIQTISLLSKKNYKPVISPLGWKLIFGYILILFVSVFTSTPSETSVENLWNKIPTDKLPKFSWDIFTFSIPSIELNEHMVIGLFAFFIMSIISWWISYKDNIHHT